MRCTIAAFLLAAPVALARPDEAMRLFPYGDVQLTLGPAAEYVKATRETYLAIPNDNLLHDFRVRAGLPAPGQPMGGWYDAEGFAGAHPFGQIISGLARAYAATGDPRFKDKADALVKGFGETIREDGFFYSSEKAFNDWGCYIYDKNCIGMRDAHTLCGNAGAMAILSKMTDWADPHMDRRHDEWYTLPENLHACFALTGEARYSRMAAEFDATTEYFGPLARGENALTPDRHAYSHVNALSSAGAAYFATGDAAYRDALANAWALLTTRQSFATGGWGPNERFVPADGATIPAGSQKDEDWSGCPTSGLYESLRCTDKHFETACGSYATLNAARYLMRAGSGAGPADALERILYNGVLPSLPLMPDGRAFYYSNYAPGARKAYHPDAWTCCAGTPGLIAAELARCVFTHDDGAVYANLFVPARVTWKRAGGDVVVDQRTTFPDSGETMFVVRATKPAEFTLAVRVPSWAQGPLAVAVNGAPIEPVVEAGYARLTRTWKTGDRANVSIPIGLRWEPVDAAHPNTCALMYGPVLMVALADEPVHFRKPPEALSVKSYYHYERPLQAIAESGVQFRPFFRVRDEAYTTYCEFAAGDR